MDNPFKTESQINPQVECGYRQIESSVFRAIISADFVASEMKVLAIIERSWGYKKKSVRTRYGTSAITAFSCYGPTDTDSSRQ